ncbi:hypothetical protein BofuT4_uP068470.1 [Botrytis cinerea T4]|uniref:Secreted protein n=1 Tax=Botryotinia fuckeliana (strain T4) TaxID=999810 RepID=G2XQU4_BOTF4|nr:hypothetical protein BofuT4_uP068470.1 [Botrytis cinerea T4]
MYYVLCIILFICVSSIASIPKNSNVKLSRQNLPSSRLNPSHITAHDVSHAKRPCLNEREDDEFMPALAYRLRRSCWPSRNR